MTAVAWLLTPLVFLALTAGLGAGLERVVGIRVPEGGLVPLGFCLGVVLALLGFWIGFHGPVVAAALSVAAAAGIVLGRASVRDAAGHRSSVVAFLGTYGLFLLPALATGHWTWSGYNFVNDTAVQMLLADHLADHALGYGPFDPARSSTGSEVVRVYLTTSYPVGSHALLAVLDTLVPGQLAPLYQPYLGLLGGTAAMALGGILGRIGMRPALAAAGGVLAMGGNLTYQYALQGNMKELALIAVLATCALLGEALAREQRIGMVVALAVCGAAMLDVYSTAGVPYLGLFSATLIVVLALRRVAFRWLLVAVGVATLVVLVTALPSALHLVTFGRVAGGTFASASALQNDLGHLLRPLELRQVAGVWLTEDYRLPVSGARGTSTNAFILVVVVAAAAGVTIAVRRAMFGVLLFAVPAVGALAILSHRVSPYANGKLLAIGSVGVMLAAGAALGATRRRGRAIAAGAGLLVALGVAWSDALAYHGVKLAPTERMAAMQDIGQRLAGRGLVLVNEPEEFAKFFFAPSQMNANTEAITPRQIELRRPEGFGNRFFDLDAQTLAYVEGFPWIVVRRSPDESRPPSNFRKVYVNAYYDVWQRTRSPEVVDHLDLQSDPGGVARPVCRDVARLARAAGPGGHLVAARRARPLVLDTAGNARRSAGWIMHPYLRDMVITSTPGSATTTVAVHRPALYRAWLKGSFGRPIDVDVDGRRIGSAVGVENLGQWHLVGDVRLAAGSHRLRISRGGGGPRPGDGYRGELGPLVLRPVTPDRMVTVAARAATSLCDGAAYDWVEAIRR